LRVDRRGAAPDSRRPGAAAPLGDAAGVVVVDVDDDGGG
jgi:hypothetical protein